MDSPTYDTNVAEAVLDAVEALCKRMEPSAPCAFEELTAEPGKMPRVMLKPLPSDPYEKRYVSGEEIRKFPFSATLRIEADSEQKRLDAHQWLMALAKGFGACPIELEGMTVFQRSLTQMPTCLGRTERFEDWQINLSLKYKTQVRSS